MLKKLINQLALIKPHLYRILFLFFVLFLISGYASMSYISVIIVVIAYIISRKLNLGIKDHISFEYFFKYLPFLFKEIFISTISVSKIIWSKNYIIDPVFEWVITKNKTDIGTVLFANSISLTPGTITISINGQNLLVHALERQSINAIKDSKMDDKVKDIFLV